MPKIIISLDFEMRWGVHHLYRSDHDLYRTELENVQDVVPATLKMLSDRNIKATWATVGALLLSSWDQYFSLAPEPPSYSSKMLNFNPMYAEKDPEGVLYFAPNLVDEIVRTSGQELAGHSFSHLYFGENGVVENDFISDTDALINAFNIQLSMKPVSYVFPRNQLMYVNILLDKGFKVWRKNNYGWHHNNSSNTVSIKGFCAKAARFSEALIPIEKNSIYRQKENIGRYISLFVRFELSDSLWKMHFYKIKKLIINLKDDDELHIWWHPHNLGKNMNMKLNRLESLLDVVASISIAQQIDLINMSELSDE